MTVTAQSPTVQSFIDALHTLEAGGDTQLLAALVASGAEVLSIDGHGPRHGPAGMTELLTQYLRQFEHVETTFTRITENDTRATLEWSSDAVLTGGHPVTYTDGQITRFRTVYDSGALLRPQATMQPVDDTRALPRRTTTLRPLRGPLTRAVSTRAMPTPVMTPSWAGTGPTAGSCPRPTAPPPPAATGEPTPGVANRAPHPGPTTHATPWSSSLQRRRASAGPPRSSMRRAGTSSCCVPARRTPCGSPRGL